MPATPLKKNLIRFVVRFILFSIIVFIRNVYRRPEWNLQIKIFDALFVALIVSLVVTLIYALLDTIAKKRQTRKTGDGNLN